MVWGLLSQPTRGLRTKGAIDALKKAGLKVDYIEINKQTNADPAAGIPTFTAYVSSHPDVKLVVTDHGALTATAQTFLKATHKGPNDIGIAGFDLSPATITAIQGGWTDLVLDQQEWLQATCRSCRSAWRRSTSSPGSTSTPDRGSSTRATSRRSSPSSSG